jgi:hypothetical protein
MGRGAKRRRERPEGGRRGALWWTRVMIFVFISAGSVLIYIALAMTLNGQPSSRPFPGWVAVLQPAAEPGSDKVMLQVQSSAAGSHPRLTYTVTACGPLSPYVADLLIGGKAQLARAQPIPPLPPTLNISLPGGHLGWPGLPQEIRDLGTEFTGGLGPAQLVHIRLTPVAPCPSSPGRGSVSSIFADSTAEVITGLASAPVQQSWKAPFGWWSGPYHSQAWPLTGTTPGGLPGPLAPSTFTLSGLPAAHYPCVRRPCSSQQDNWALPPTEYLLVNNTQQVPVNWSVDTTESTLADASTLSWLSPIPFSPSGSLTDSHSVSILQQLLVVAGVGMGIGGAMMASLAFELLRLTNPEGAASSNAQGNTPSGGNR